MVGMWFVLQICVLEAELELALGADLMPDGQVDMIPSIALGVQKEPLLVCPWVVCWEPLMQ